MASKEEVLVHPVETLSLFERRAHACVLHNDRLYFWGGIVVVSEQLPEDSSSDDEDSDEEGSTPFPSVAGIPPGVLRVRKNLPHTKEKLIDVYDIRDKLWYQYGTSGDVPPPDYGATMCVLNDHIYLYGGYNDFHFSSDLYRLDLSTMIWKMMEPSTDIKPSPVYRTSLIEFTTRNLLVAFGGVCEAVPQERLTEAHAEYREHQATPHSYGCNNEYHEYDVREGCWKIPEVVGRPSPRCGHCMIVIDHRRAVLYGGISGETALDDLHILDMAGETRTFYEIRRPTSPDTPWPLPRTFHPICSLNPPCTRAEDNSGTCAQVFVLWGRDTKSSVADEAGILTFNKDVTEVSYKKYALPLVPRYWHTATAYCKRSSQSVLIFVFGGNFPSVTERFGEIARSPKNGLRLWRGDFRILEWGRDFPTLQSLCMDAISNNFNVLSKRLLQLRGSPLLTEVKEYHRRKSYYSHIPLDSSAENGGDGGCSTTQFLCGVGYGRAIPQR